MSYFVLVNQVTEQTVFPARLLVCPAKTAISLIDVALIMYITYVCNIHKKYL